MKAVPASLVAMSFGWALPLVGMAAGQVVASGRTADVGVMAFWVGLFTLIGWAIAVLPLVLRFGHSKCVSDLRWSWLSWSGLGVLVFTVLLTPIMGRAAFLIIWYPALMGSIAGFVFALLTRTRNEKTA